MTIPDTVAVLGCGNCRNTNDVPLDYVGGGLWSWACPDCHHEQTEETRFLFDREGS